jgi:hypothetical protein
VKKTYRLVDGLALGDAVAESSGVGVIVRLARGDDGVGVRPETCRDEDGGDLGRSVRF